MRLFSDSRLSAKMQLRSGGMLHEETKIRGPATQDLLAQEPHGPESLPCALLGTTGAELKGASALHDRVGLMNVAGAGPSNEMQARVECAFGASIVHQNHSCANLMHVEMLGCLLAGRMSSITSHGLKLCLAAPVNLHLWSSAPLPLDETHRPH